MREIEKITRSTIYVYVISELLNLILCVYIDMISSMGKTLYSCKKLLREIEIVLLDEFPK